MSIQVGDLLITIQRGTCGDCVWLRDDGDALIRCTHPDLTQPNEHALFYPPGEDFGCNLHEASEESA